MKDTFIISVLTTDNEIGFYTGNSIDTLKTKAKIYNTATGATNAAFKLNKNVDIKVAAPIHKNVPLSYIRNSFKNYLSPKKKHVVKKKRVIKKRAVKKKRTIKKKLIP